MTKRFCDLCREDITFQGDRMSICLDDKTHVYASMELVGGGDVCFECMKKIYRAYVLHDFKTSPYVGMPAVTTDAE